MENHARVQSINFFRAKLLSLTSKEQLDDFLYQYEKESKVLRKEIVELMWYLRGSLSRDAAWSLSPSEREEYVEYIAERMKIVEKTRLPLI